MTEKVAIPQTYYDDDGYAETVYLDPDTLKPIEDLIGYNVLGPDGQYYEVTKDADADGDGSVTPSETTSEVGRLRRDGHTTARDANPDAGKGTMNTNAADNYGYQSKPGWTGPAATAIGMFNPALGMVAKVGNAAWNANNQSAVNSARQMLGLAPLGIKDNVKGVMKDQKGQIADVSINDQNYSVGFEAMSPTGKTNLTPEEARVRGLTLGGITEKAKPQSKLEKAMFEDNPEDVETSVASGSKSRMSKLTGLDEGFASKALSKVTGLKPGFMTKALDKVFGVPETAPVPAARPEEMATPTATAGAAMSTAKATPATTKATPQPAAGLVSHPNNPLGIGNKDPLGRVSIEKVDFGKLGLNPAMAAKMKDFQKEAVDQGLKLSVDVANTKRTPEQQAAIQAAGYSKTKNSYHNVGLAVDISPTEVDEKGRITDQATLEKSRALAQKYGLGLLDPSWDPAHMQQTVPGETAKTLSRREVDAFGNIKMSPEEDLGIRANSVPTPTPSPGYSPEVDRNYAEQAKATAFSPEVDRNYSAQAVAATAPEVDRNYSNQGFPSLPDKAPTPGYKPDLDPTQHRSAFDSIAPSQKATANAVSPVDSTNAKLGTSPAARAAMGLTARTPAEKAAMAQTIAGELSPATLDGLSKNDPVARAEFGAMVASMENRAESKMYAGIEKTLNPTQYNSLMDANMATTKNNYSKYSKALETAMDDFYSGKLTENLDATSYYNPDISNPAWGSKMQNPVQVGKHLFGSLPEYGPDAAAQKAAAAAMGLMAGTNYSPGKAKDDNPGAYAGGGTGTTYGGAAGQSGGAGYSPGGMNSPSGSSAGGSGYGGYGPSGNSSTGGGSGYGGGVAGGGTATGGSAGMSGGGGYSPGGMGSPSGSSASSPSSSGSNRGLGGPTSNNSGMSGGNKAGGSVGKGGGYASSAPSGASGGL